MSRHVWENIVTANTSIAHVGERLGTINQLRRERILTPKGLTDIPIISGNVTRGALRNIGTALWLNTLDTAITPANYHTLASGGTLMKTGVNMTAAQLAELKEICPQLGVFGAATGGRIVNSKLTVGKMIPVCQETVALLPAWVAEEGMFIPSIWDMTQLEEYSKFPRTNLGEETQMRFSVETFVPGSRFFWKTVLTHPTPQEYSFTVDVLTQFINDGGPVGGYTKIGLGNVSVEPHTPIALGETPWAVNITKKHHPLLKLLN